MALLAGFIWFRLLADDPLATGHTGNTGSDAVQVDGSKPASSPLAGTASGQMQPPAMNRPGAPEALQATVTALGRTFDGDVGIVVQSIDDGWAAAHKGDLRLPQQSLSKLWVAAALLDKVAAGEIALEDQVTLTARDLSIFHQPIRKRILASGSYTTTIADLLRRAMTQSDNTANAALFDAVGGRSGVLRFLRAQGLNEIWMAPSEKQLQMSITGMEWQDSFSYGRNFWEARKRVPFAQRMQTMGAYLANPPDGAAPVAVADGLAKLARGELLPKPYNAYLIDLMAKSKTGPKRLRGGLSPGWSLPHKTGTGQVLKLLATAYNDVGILISPSGRRYSVVAMIGATNRPVKERQQLMQALTRAVIAYENNSAVY